MARIFLVDHDVTACNALAKVISALGYSVACAYSGAEAIDRLPSAQPDLLIVNLMMTRLDGWQVLQWLASQRGMRNLPIIVNSELSPKLWQLAQAQGAVEMWPRNTQTLADISESLEQHLAGRIADVA